MRIKIPVFLLMLLVGEVNAQSSGFNFIGNTPSDSTADKKIYFLANGILASNTVSSHMFSDYLFSDHFTDASRNKFINNTNSRTNIDVAVGFELNWTFAQGELAFTYDNQVYYGAGHELSRLMLFGNKPFAGLQVNSENNRFLHLEQTIVKYRRNWDINDKITLKLGVGPGLTLNYRKLDAERLGIFTEENGSYLDITAQNLNGAMAVDGHNGVSINYDIEADFQLLPKTLLSVYIESGAVFFGKTSMNTIAFDSSFRFEGLEFSPAQLTEGGFDYVSDSIAKALNLDSSSAFQSVLPYNLRIQFIHAFDDRHALAVKGSSKQWGYYGFRVELAHVFTPLEVLRIKSSLEYGDFKGLVWSEEAELKTGRNLNIYLGLHGLNSAFLPLSSTSYGVSFGIMKPL